MIILLGNNKSYGSNLIRKLGNEVTNGHDGWCGAVLYHF